MKRTGEKHKVLTGIIVVVILIAVVAALGGGTNTDTTKQAGMFKVGKDIQPGEYKVTSEGMGYIQVSSDSTHGLHSIVTNDNFEGDKYITVADGQYLKLTRAKIVE